MITSLYAGILAILYFQISIDTIKARRKHKISLGYGPNDEIASIVSAHSNFSSYAIFLLLLVYMLEQSSAIHAIIIHALALAFTAGRFLHFYAFRTEKMRFRNRVLGMYLTLWPLLILGFLNIYAFFA